MRNETAQPPNQSQGLVFLSFSPEERQLAHVQFSALVPKEPRALELESRARRGFLEVPKRSSPQMFFQRYLMITSP